MVGESPLEPSDHVRKSPSRERGLPSPRLQHFDGDVPPALSPLDAFALQGRLLAKQFDQSRVSGRRLSRLPPSSVARSLSQPRVGYFRSQSDEDARRPARSPGPAEPRRWGGGGGGGGGLEVEEPAFRPKSQHPHISGVPQHEVETIPPWDKSFASYAASNHDYGMPRAESPELFPRSPTGGDEQLAPGKEREKEKKEKVKEKEKEKEKAPEGGLGIMRPRQQSSGDSSTRFYAAKTLAPPTPALGRVSGSHGSVHQESSDDDYYEASSNAGSTFSKPRKMSSSSGVSMPVSPMSHPVPRPRRSPSPKSDANASPYILQRPSFNFSRPLSRSSTTLSLPSPSTQPRRPSPAPSPVPSSSRTINRSHVPSPITLPGPPADSNATGSEEPPKSAGTYIYAKYALPRGREVSRDSTVFSGLQTPHFEWKEPLFEKTPPPSAVQERFARTPSPPPVPAQRSVTPKKLHRTSPAHKSPAAKSVRKVEQSPSPSARNSFEPVARDTAAPEEPKTAEETNTLKTSKSQAEDDAKSTSVRSESTIRPETSRTEATAAGKPHAQQMTAEEQVAKGIACHESGSLNESTYHFRLAALHNHPTGMLMYALACRHGWGMRPNQQEGVKWLRKAVDSAGLDLNNVDGPAMQGGGKNQSMHEQKTRQAQFALSIYELGVSHLKGWGTNQDKPFALRCFEIASHWGDIDALAEAGYCYAEGIGCKKDLKKAAKYYRMAESKGMSMVGNSWIYKDKYMSSDNTVPPPGANLKSTNEADKKGRNKPRSKSIFGRKKPFAVAADE